MAEALSCAPGLSVLRSSRDISRPVCSESLSFPPHLPVLSLVWSRIHSGSQVRAQGHLGSLSSSLPPVSQAQVPLLFISLFLTSQHLPVRRWVSKRAPQPHWHPRSCYSRVCLWSALPNSLDWPVCLCLSCCRGLCSRSPWLLAKIHTVPSSATRPLQLPQDSWCFCTSASSAQPRSLLPARSSDSGARSGMGH